MYNHNKIEKKWQKYWEENKTFKFQDNPNKPKFYVLDMFPYPSGKGLHVGHVKGYTATDVISRYKRLKGFDVLHPMGWDAFGLPAEQYALDTNNHPSQFTQNNIDVFRKQLKMLGFDYDYEKEIDTTDPNFYKWTQWIFIQLYKNGLAEIQDIDVNWCENLGTVLSNEEVVLNADGMRVSERGGHPVIKKPMKQWVLKIVEYADKLIEGLDEIEFNESVKILQKNWIGKSEGVNLTFNVENLDVRFDIFTTRIDTIYGVSYVALAPEHPLVNQITTPQQKQEVEEYVLKTKATADLDRITNTNKTGVFSGAYAINPINQQKVPIWIADYVLSTFGSGAVMGVPAHDERDFEFANKYNLEIKQVIQTNQKLPYMGDGKHINSPLIDSLNIDDATLVLINHIKENKLGKQQNHYKLRNWIFSRQRYWGEPFPVLFDANGKIKIIENIPVKLPDLKEFKPSGSGESPLANAVDWLYLKDNEGNIYRRETNTMPQWAGSSWYFLAYILKNADGSYTDLNSLEAKKRFAKWLPVDLYIGGQEHAVLHLLYSRFWHKFLYDIGVVPTKEPFAKLINQGMILGENGEKMSKSKGNVINPDDIISSHGADTLRVYEMFMGPITASLPWSDDGLDAMRKWLDRVYRLYLNLNELDVIENIDDVDKQTTRAYHLMIKNFANAIEQHSFNIAISEMMIFVNVLYKNKKINYQMLDSLIIMLSCFAPHLSEELYSTRHNQSVCLQSFPVYDESKMVLDMVTIPIQINGKLKTTIEVQLNTPKEELLTLAKENHLVKEAITNKEIKKEIVVVNKIINLVI